ncbi:hypothetical protein MRX96_010323 [Rhipicephalus microplus]
MSRGNKEPFALSPFSPACTSNVPDTGLHTPRQYPANETTMTDGWLVDGLMEQTAICFGKATISGFCGEAARSAAPYGRNTLPIPHPVLTLLNVEELVTQKLKCRHR